ncbi:MAG: hypothetical protein HYZ75_17770 [Elusimicrobia bacterium]|nr:hypothetical protein [Elusimicrobiota bacterium]
MFTLLSWIIQAVLGGVVAVGTMQLVKSKVGWQRALGWFVGVLFSWWCLKCVFWDIRMVLAGQLSQLVTLGIHGWLGSATVACLIKGAREASGSLPYKPGQLRKLRD